MDEMSRWARDGNWADFANSQPRHPERATHSRRQYRTIWFSDVDLGTRRCNAEMLIDFLDHVDSERMYLVGEKLSSARETVAA